MSEYNNHMDEFSEKFHKEAREGFICTTMFEVAQELSNKTEFLQRVRDKLNEKGCTNVKWEELTTAGLSLSSEIQNAIDHPW